MSHFSKELWDECSRVSDSKMEAFDSTLITFMHKLIHVNKHDSRLLLDYSCYLQNVCGVDLFSQTENTTFGEHKRCRSTEVFLMVVLQVEFIKDYKL